MKTSGFLAVVAILCQLGIVNAYGRKIIILADTVPYAKGTISTYVHDYVPTRLDTVLFHGCSFNFIRKQLLTPESWNNRWGIAFDTSMLSMLGVSDLAHWDTIGGITLSSDTLWANANQLPVNHRSSLLLYDRIELADTLHSMLFIDYGYDGSFSCNGYSLSIFPNAKIIVYMQNKDNRSYKLQFERMTTQIDTNSGCFAPLYTAPDSIYINWAVDSASNGKFVSPTHTAPANTIVHRSRTSGLASNLVLTNKSDGLLVRRESRIYDIRGRVMRDRIMPSFR